MNEYCPGVQRVCVAPEKCCLSGTVCCVPTSVYSLHDSDHSNNRLIIERDIRFSVINLWYFWFAIVFFVTTCSGVCAFWRRQRRMLLQAAERSATLRLQLNRCSSHRVQLSPTLSRRQLGLQRQYAAFRSPVGHWQLGQHRQHREPAVVVDPHMSYLATIVPVGYLRDDDEEEPGTMLQFPDPPLYSDVVTDKDGEQFAFNDEVPPSYAEASRYTHQGTSVAAAAASVDVNDAVQQTIKNACDKHDDNNYNNNDDDDDDDDADEQAGFTAAGIQS